MGKNGEIVNASRVVITVVALIVGGSILINCPGCKTATMGKSAPAGSTNELAQAQKLFEDGLYTDAMLKCVDIAHVNPTLPGLPELQNKIVGKLTEERAKAALLRSSTGYRTMEVDVLSKRAVPETYGLRRTINPGLSPLRTPPTSMQATLKKPVTVHLDNVELDQFILAVGTTEGINIICDSGAGAGKTMTLHADKVPLKEVLDYVSKNLGVTFYVGENIIWATAVAPAGSKIPLVTRLYRLRKGISGEEIDKGDRINLVEAIDKFVVKEDGSDMLFDKKAHILIVKNSRENLALVEDLIDRLDVCPPQILIEARFISTSISDLRELGIDWIMNSPLVVSRKPVTSGGTTTEKTRTEINSGASLTYASFPNSSQGANLTYQGLLTDPMFKAVLHALHISGKTRTLSVPKVTTVNNRPAVIRIGEDFRFFEEYQIQSVPTSVTDAGSQVYSSILVPVGSPRVEELGITLNVTPSVGGDLSSITIRLTPEISEFVRWEFYQVGSGSGSSVGGTNNIATNALSMVKLPIFRRSKIDTELIVDSGETVVMGGLITSTETKSQSGIPFFSWLPIIGKFFTRNEVQEQKQNLLIFVTASILSERGENLVPIVPEAEPQPEMVGQRP